MSTASIHPPKYPAVSPMRTPMIAPTMVAFYGNDHGNTGAVDDTGQDITAKVIRAEEMSGV